MQYSIMNSVPRSCLISVIGATGTGKTKLAVAIARRFGGEIINGDALQLYEGLPIVTNKIRVSEMCGVKHHLLGRLGLGEEPWTVSQFTPEATRVIEDIKSRGKLPILVGGTHYYTQSLLLKKQYLGTNVDVGARDLSFAESENRWPILKGSEEDILSKLWEVDPEMAERWHPKDTRRIRRSLEIWFQTGKKASELYANQRGSSNDHESPADLEISLEGEAESVLRYNCLTFCTYIGKDDLDQRLSDRVDEMLGEGLIAEVQLMRRRYQELMKGLTPPDSSRGIWVAIGYKEFTDYLAACELGTTDEDNLTALRLQAVERTKIATRQYARRQMKWIKHKLLPTLLRAAGNDAVVLLDCSSLSAWKERVEDPAIALTGDFLRGRPLNVTAEMQNLLAEFLVDSKPDGVSRLPRPITCDICGVTMMNKAELEQHPRTSRHKRALKDQRRGRPPRHKAIAEEAEVLSSSETGD